MVLALASTAGAQVRPDLPWRTLVTEHVRVHYTPELEPLALRTAANAEWAWARLAAELPPPRGTVDIVVADNVDFANGYATPYPTNRIVIYARPPVEEMSLRNHVDWNRTVVTHELAHIFQLDRVAGWWRLAQRVFGRAAPFFPHAYAPTWLLEGVAVHYETKLAGGGRLAGTEFPAHARAIGLGDALPAVDAIVTPRPYFPGGTTPYLFGSFLVDATLRHDPTIGDDEAMRRLLDRMSGRLLPRRHNANARAAVGASFSEIYAAWRDSVVRDAAEADPAAADATEAAGVRTLTTHAWTARHPRFLPSGELIYVADDRRRSPGLYHLGPDARRRRIGRRNSVDANSPFEGARTVQGEFEFTDQYSLHSDLFSGQGVARRRLTRGQRLSHPDVHQASGRIVAVQTIPGGTQLVTLTRDDALARPLTVGSLDRVWSEPRWSRDGTRIAAALWERGGRTSIVVLDAEGRELRRFSPRGPRLTVVSSPAWAPGDSMVVFASDHEGRTMLYRGDVRSGAYALIWATRTALNTPDVSADGARIAAVELRADGYRVVTREMPGAVPLHLPDADAEPLPPVEESPLVTEPGRTTFVASETARPAWWLPASGVADDGTASIGAIAGGVDVIGRHRWELAVLRSLAHPEFSGGASYTYAGLGNPSLAFGLSRDWAHARVVSGGDFLGTLALRSDVVSATLVASRPRVRRSTYFVLGGEVGFERYRTYPWNLLSRFSDPAFQELHVLPRAVTAVGVSTLQRPGLSVSTEDGVALNAVHRARFREDLADGFANEVILTANAAKSIPLPGFARHVVAARAAFGMVDEDSRAGIGIGGVSGSSIELLPGLSVGGSARTFFIRGFEGGVQSGVRAATASAEYRAPLFRVGRGLGFVPAFLQKTSALAFADAGAAWCDRAVTGSPVCEDPIAPRTVLASVGGELTIDAALLQESLYRFRIGVARPVRGTAFAAQSVTYYFTLGNTF